MKKIFILGLIALAVAESAFAAETTGENFSTKIGEIDTQMKTVSGSASNIIAVISYVIGLIFVGWGIYDLFIDEDQQHQNKKAKGGLKIIGGGLLIGIVNVAKWIKD